MIVVFQWIEGCKPRLAAAQERLEASILRFGLHPLRYPAGPKLELFGDVLAFARERVDGEAFCWCNSDVELTHDPQDVPDPSIVYGFRRREIPDGRYVYGIDMYRIPVEIWDGILSRDIPALYLGTSFVDWWISRKMEQLGRYATLTGYIDHLTHEKSSAAGDDRNPYYQANFRAYNAWARRNGLDTIPAPPFLLPKVGHVWGLRDAAKKLFSRKTKTKG